MLKCRTGGFVWRTGLLALTGAVAFSVSACSTQTYRDLAGYEVPPDTQPVPDEFPNVFTGVTRDDRTRSQAGKTALVKDLNVARRTHVRSTRRNIENDR